MTIKIQWDKDVNASNIETHGIDFIDATKIFFEDRLEIENGNHSKNTLIAIGNLQETVILVSYQVVKEGICIISARRASRNERDLYAERLSESSGAKPLGVGEGPQR